MKTADAVEFAGDLVGGGAGTRWPVATMADRFWAKVRKDGPIHPTLGTPCWLWTAYVNKRGYGVFGVDGRKTELAHRIASVIRDGPLPAGMLVLHIPGCSSKTCVLHTYRGTQKQNMADAKDAGSLIGRRVPSGTAHYNGRKTHCMRGHALIEPFARVKKNKRTCRICETENRKALEERVDKEIRAAVFRRANGACEACGCEITETTGHLDHQRGRIREAEAVKNCWAVCPPCHRARTGNKPNSTFWWWKIAAWAVQNGYGEEAEHAQLMIDKQKQKGLAP